MALFMIYIKSVCGNSPNFRIFDSRIITQKFVLFKYNIYLCKSKKKNIANIL